MKGWMLACCIGITVSLFGQARLEGLFEGTITLGGLESSQKMRVDMFLKINQYEITGRTYAHTSEGKVVEMELRGWRYEDYSVYLEETREVVHRDGEPEQAPMKRKYQLRYGGNFNEVQLTGFWQEITDTPFNKQRQLGKVKLVKVKSSKA